jgi:recombination protein RecR
MSSRLIDSAVQAFASLPGIGRKTAMRLTLHLLHAGPETTERFAEALVHMRRHIRFCADCHNVADAERCSICESPRRNRSIVCVVENIRDLMAIENTGQYHGLYHVLGGVISPLDGVGPQQLNLDSLLRRAAAGEIREVVMALNPTIEGDTTVYYLGKQLRPYGVQLSNIARGVSFGGELEYADELTLGRSIVARTPIQPDAG